ncbi:competence protein CoiA family protein [Streptomyces sp. NPDC015125]|uniref:competence protein CoiA n=1 Tax=Streptomyces sp. NPDC015125 TaxID=3364938 RepID=UPI0036FD5E8E
MAFTALHPNVGRIDATLPARADGLTWAQLHRTRPRVPLTCPDCAWTMHARLSPRKLRYFAHDPGRPGNCALTGESLAHHLIKLVVASAVRTAGWHAELEVRAPDGSWRADVLATSPDGSSRTAWEAQLSHSTQEQLWARTRQYNDAGIVVCWVTDRDTAPWMGALPSARLRPGDHHEPWTVDDGPADFSYTHARWTTAPLTLERFVDQVNRRMLTSQPILDHYGLVRRTSDNQQVRRHRLWTSADAIRNQDRHEASRRAEEKQAKEKEGQRHALEAEMRRNRDAGRVTARASREAEAERWRTAQEAQARQREEERAGRQRQQRLAAEQRRVQQLENKQRGRRWWRVLTDRQLHDFMNAVAHHLDQRGVRPHIPTREMHDHPELGYGIPVFALGRYPHLHGIVRPCPDLVADTPQLRSGTRRIYVRNASEAGHLADAGVEAVRIQHFDLPDHDQPAPAEKWRSHRVT